jgi:hypothetical protein
MCRKARNEHQDKMQLQSLSQNCRMPTESGNLTVFDYLPHIAPIDA